ncbi:MAG: TrkH family potassium uptake protein, partial [Bacteroidales bacterium]|nr:TrkH family potassium uptake protein [Bacteroidales bacterium]
MPRAPFNIRIIFRFLGYLLFIESLFMLLTAGVAYLYHESDLRIFLVSAAITLGGGLALSLAGWKASTLVGKHESFVIVTMVWILFSLFG